jgi:hypothetical protein
MIEATINYLSPASRINRFFWAPEGRLSTSVSVPHRVEIHDARTAGRPFTLDRHGFTLVERATQVASLEDRAVLDSIYAAEVMEIAQDLTGADQVVPMGYELRSSDAGERLMLPPAARAHIDYDTRTAHQIAQRRYRKTLPDGPVYDRFILFSLWRCFSPPPQDWPLALCDFESSKDTANVRTRWAQARSSHSTPDIAGGGILT